MDPATCPKCQTGYFTHHYDDEKAPTTMCGCKPTNGWVMDFSDSEWPLVCPGTFEYAADGAASFRVEQYRKQGHHTFSDLQPVSPGECYVAYSPNHVRVWIYWHKAALRSAIRAHKFLFSDMMNQYLVMYSDTPDA